MLFNAGIRNISAADYLKAYLGYISRPFVSRLRAFLTYRKVYRNYPYIIFQMSRNQYPIVGVNRDGTQRFFNNRLEITFITQLLHLGCKEFEIDNNTVTIWQYSLENKHRMKIQLHDAISNGELFDIFFNKIYRFLPTDGKTVIDIGANIGDSCIYFALGNANRVIAYEPFPRNYEFARKNVHANGFADKITLQLAGCHAERGDITIDPEYRSNDCSELMEFRQGIKIPLLTLQDILDECKLPHEEVVLKMDCEGCEYDSIIRSTASTLTTFSHIQIEYHNGYKNIKEKLENCGFHVSVTSPLRERSKSGLGKSMLYTGFIYAVKNE